jgi:hypothetical protein
MYVCNWLWDKMVGPRTPDNNMTSLLLHAPHVHREVRTLLPLFFPVGPQDLKPTHGTTLLLPIHPQRIPVIIFLSWL